jgi:hypothetical protein
MRTYNRLMLMVGAVVLAGAAHASLTYNVEQASVAFNNGDTDNLNFVTNGNAIDFTANNFDLKVGDGAVPHNSATITIIYTVQSTKAISGLNLVFSGWSFGNAGIGYSEFVEKIGGGALGQINGTKLGAGLGGSNDPFTQVDDLTFSQSVFSYKVKKTFTLANLDSNPAASFASIGLIEQNAVPEPATMGALAIGALGLMARRRRK